jgi:hypothetical protein
MTSGKRCDETYSLLSIGVDETMKQQKQGGGLGWEERGQSGGKKSPMVETQA